MLGLIELAAPSPTFHGSWWQVPQYLAPHSLQLLLYCCIQYQHMMALQWPCRREGWESGGAQTSHPLIFSPTSYAILFSCLAELYFCPHPIFVPCSSDLFSEGLAPNLLTY